MFFHNYHILSLSSYPYLFFFCMFGLVSSFLFFFSFGYYNIFFFLVFFFLVFLWVKDIFMEGVSGFHNFYVQDGFKFSLILFIFSEFMFFFGLFWFFFDCSLVSDVFLGLSWSPVGVSLVNPFGVPFLNSCILLSSGVSVTFCHYCLLSSSDALFGLFFTIILALYFILVQSFEYFDSSFNFSDSVFGGIFYLLTGFHGLHVIFGTVFLFLNFVRLLKNHFNFNHHLGLEFGIIYWHFVDVVWLFLFIFVYWWVF